MSETQKEAILEANVINSDEVDEFAQRLADDYAANKHVAAWITSTLRNKLITSAERAPLHVLTRATGEEAPSWLTAAIDRGEKLTYADLSPAAEDEARHIIDYLNARFNRPVRISYDDAKRAAENWGVDPAHGDKDDSEEVKDFLVLQSGYKWVKLVGFSAFERESALMQHCVGQGSVYFDRAKAGKIAVYSLRDKSNKPHATAEINVSGGKYIDQLKGKQNKAPVERYWDMCDALVQKFPSPRTGQPCEDLTRLGYVVSTQGKYVRIDKASGEKLGSLTVTPNGPYDSIPAGVSVRGVVMVMKSIRVGDGFECASDLALMSRGNGRKVTISCPGTIKAGSLRPSGACGVECRELNCGLIETPTTVMRSSLSIKAKNVSSRVLFNKTGSTLNIEAGSFQSPVSFKASNANVEARIASLQSSSISFESCTGYLECAALKTRLLRIIDCDMDLRLDKISASKIVIEQDFPDGVLMSLDEASIKSSDGIKVRCRTLRARSLSIGCWLTIEMINAKSVKTALTVDGPCDIIGKEIKEIEAPLNVKGELDLSLTSISEVGRDVSCDSLVVKKDVRVDPRAKIRKITRR